MPLSPTTPTIDDYEARKQALRDQVREAGERAALIYAADKLANSSDLRGAYAEIGENVVVRLKISLDGRIRIWRDGPRHVPRAARPEGRDHAHLDEQLTALERDRERRPAG